MKDRKGKEEYQLPEEEHFESRYEEEEPYEVQPEKRAFSVKELLLNKKVWVPALIMLLIYGVYKFMEYRDNAQLKAHKQAEVPQAPKPLVQQQQQPSAVNENLMVKNELQTAIEQTNKNQAQLDTVGSQLNQLQQTQTQMNNALTELSTAVKALTSKLEEAKPPEIKEKRIIVKKRIEKRRHRVVRAPAYHIRAVVPGRAWLRSSSGRLFTVKVGEVIAGYGTVEEIDVERGVVLTSSGREITYGKYDS